MKWEEMKHQTEFVTAILEAGIPVLAWGDVPVFSRELSKQEQETLERIQLEYQIERNT